MTNFQTHLLNPWMKEWMNKKEISFVAENANIQFTFSLFIFTHWTPVFYRAAVYSAKRITYFTTPPAKRDSRWEVNGSHWVGPTGSSSQGAGIALIIAQQIFTPLRPAVSRACVCATVVWLGHGLTITVRMWASRGIISACAASLGFHSGSSPCKEQALGSHYPLVWALEWDTWDRPEPNSLLGVTPSRPRGMRINAAVGNHGVLEKFVPWHYYSKSWGIQVGGPSA